MKYKILDVVANIISMFVLYILLTIFVIFALWAGSFLLKSKTLHYTRSEAPEKTSFLAKVTAYSEIDSCHYSGCPMANGEKAHVGAVACPRSVKLGTKVTIDGEEYTCKDRTNLNLDGRYDIFFGYGKESHKKALNFGIQTKEVTIYKLTIK